METEFVSVAITYH